MIDRAKGKVADADACVAADAKGKVAKAMDKAVGVDARKCAAAPPFAYAGAPALNAAAAAQAEALWRDLLDAGAGLTVIDARGDAAGALCQKKVLAPVEKLLGLVVDRFNACKKDILATVADAATLRDACLARLTTERADRKSKLAKTLAKLTKAREKGCAGVALAGAFPGSCGVLAAAAFDGCVEQRAACRGCLVLDAMDALDADCDAFDDGALDASCATTTTTATVSTTTTTDATSTTSTTSTSTTTSSVSTTSTTMPAEVFTIAIGDTVSDGVPAAGAGNLEVPGARDRYEFTAAPGQVIYFDELAATGTSDVPYELRDAAGALVHANTLGGFEPGRLTLVAGGLYAITVGSVGSTATGTYAFTLVDVPADDVFPIAIGDPIADGVPAAGAGNIEVPGARDVYTFAGVAGQVVYVDELSASGTNGLAYVITDPSSAVLATNALGGFEPGRLTLPLTGTYTITVGGGTNDAVGTYGFTLWAVPPDDVFAIAIGDTVADGVPAAGAGNIESPGVRDVYTFDASAGIVLRVDEQAVSGVDGLAYVIRDPNDMVIVSNALGGFEPPDVTLGATGTYTMTVGADTNDATGTYAFQLISVP